MEWEQIINQKLAKITRTLAAQSKELIELSNRVAALEEKHPNYPPDLVSPVSIFPEAGRIWLEEQRRIIEEQKAMNALYDSKLRPGNIQPYE